MESFFTLCAYRDELCGLSLFTPTGNGFLFVVQVMFQSFKTLIRATFLKDGEFWAERTNSVDKQFINDEKMQELQWTN